MSQHCHHVVEWIHRVSRSFQFQQIRSFKKRTETSQGNLQTHGHVSFLNIGYFMKNCTHLPNNWLPYSYFTNMFLKIYRQQLGPHILTVGYRKRVKRIAVGFITTATWLPVYHLSYHALPFELPCSTIWVTEYQTLSQLFCPCYLANDV